MKRGFMLCSGHCQQCPEGLGRDTGPGAWGLWLSPITSSTRSGRAQLAPTAEADCTSQGGTADGLAHTEGRQPSGLVIKWTRTELATKINTTSTQISNTCVTLRRQKSNYFKMIFYNYVSKFNRASKSTAVALCGEEPQKAVTELLWASAGPG